MAEPEFTIYVDGGCALCAREARLMQRLDKGRGRLEIVDIADPAFEPERLGATADELMREIHGRTRGGRVVTGVEVFRRSYAAVGWGWTLAWTGWPVIRPIVDWAYRRFAAVRLRLPGNSSRCRDGRCSAQPQP